MTPQQFEVISRLIRSKPGPAQEAARAILIGGLSPTAAAATAGCSLQSASQAARRFREAAALIQSAWG